MNDPISAKHYIEQKACQFARGVISVSGPTFGYVFVYSKDGHSWSMDYPTTWYGRKLKVFYSACVHYEIQKETLNLKVWMNSDLCVIGAE